MELYHLEMIKNTYTNLGYIKDSKTLVYVDSPSKMTGYNTLLLRLKN